MRSRRRTIGLCILSLVALTISGCIRPTDDALTSAADDGATTDVADPNSPDGGGDTDADEPQEASDDGDAGPVGPVAEVYCAELIAVTDVPNAGQTGVFQAASSAGDFSSWLASDEVSFDADAGRLTNRDRDLDVAAALLGVRDRTARIVSVSSGHTTITLDDGSFWTIAAADRDETLDWRITDEVVVAQPPDAADAWRLVNLRRCEVIQVERIS
jgi:hypothetical protein